MKTDLLSLVGANLREQAENYLDTLPPLMMWGGFVFQLSTLAYSKLTLQDSWNWASQGRSGKRDLLQYTGKKAPTLTFDCELYAAFLHPSLLTSELQKYGLMGAIAADPPEHLRVLADTRTPQMLVTGTGKVMGYWALTQMNQVMDAFRPDSQPTHQTLSLTMQFYGFRLPGNDEQPSFPVTPTKREKLSGALSEMEGFLKKWL
jgi:phage protein U